MDYADTMEQARDVIAQTFGLSPIQVPDSISAGELSAWDSLHHFTLITALEERFSVAYGSDEIPHMTSLQAIVDVTTRHVS